MLACSWAWVLQVRDKALQLVNDANDCACDACSRAEVLTPDARSHNHACTMCANYAGGEDCWQSPSLACAYHTSPAGHVASVSVPHAASCLNH